jgi:RNA polymerase sigma-32 factor
MIQAVRRFDPDRGFRLATYAMWWIRASIQEYILHSWSLVKMGTTAGQKKLFFNLRRIKSQMRAFEDGDLSPEMVARIADELRVSEDEIVHMNRRLRAPDQSLNAPVGEDRDEERQDWLADDSENQEERLVSAQAHANRHAMLARALGTLSPRERHILVNRRLRERPATLEDLSQHHGISRERIRQIESRTFDKVRKSVRNTAIAQALRA